MICLSSLKNKYLSSAFVLLLSTVIVKVVGAVYKIPLTAFIGGVGRGYFAYAYNLFMPVHAITMGVFPIALSRLVSTYNSKGDEQRVASLKKGSFRLFVAVGLAGMCLLLAVSRQYSLLVAGSPSAVYTIAVLAPSVLFSSMAASYRGYYEGFLNMIPTAISQTIEALFKMIFGLLFARMSMVYFVTEYEKTGMVLGKAFENEAAALSAIYPYTSAFAMLGVTLGALAGLCFLWCYSLFNGKPTVKACDVRGSQRELLLFSFPIMISTGVQSIFQFFDTASIQVALGKVNIVAIKSMLMQMGGTVQAADKDLPTYMYGLYSSALDFKNLIPSITMALGVASVPAISRAFEQGSRERFEALVNSIYKYTMLLSVIGGIILYSCADDILNLLYGKSSPDIAASTVDLVKALSLTAFLYSLAGTAVFSVQAVGLAKKSILPYAVSGIIRVALNVLLVGNGKYILYGAVISGAVGYAVLSGWCIAIVCKNTKTRISFIKIFALPVLAGIATLFVYKHMNLYLIGINSSIVNIIVKCLFVVSVYCILCFLCGMLNFRRFFRDFVSKKNKANA